MPPLPPTTNPPCSPAPTKTTTRRTNRKVSSFLTLKPPISPVRPSTTRTRPTVAISKNSSSKKRKLPLEAIVLLFACASALVSFFILHTSAATTTTTSTTIGHEPTSLSHDHRPSNKNKNNNNIPIFPHSDNPHSAVSLLAQTLPDSVVIHHIGPNVTNNNNNNTTNRTYYAGGTIVSAYFRLKSKYSSEKYEQEWMQHFLSLQDPMVIFTTQADVVDLIVQQRQHAPTVIVELQQLTDLPIAYLSNQNNNEQNNKNKTKDVDADDDNDLDFGFWKHQLQIDPERKRHQSYQLFWIWLSKTWFVQQAVQLNFFASDFFVWSDIGCFRRKQYHGKMLLNAQAIQHVMPDQKTILWMAHHDINPPYTGWLWNDKYSQKQHFYHSGSQGAGYAAAWTQFLPRLADTMDAFTTANMFIGEDQCLLQATCLRYPDNCAYVPTRQVPDNHYFGLRHVLHHYNEKRRPQQLPKYNLWRPPSNIPKSTVMV